jgi:DNA polymerase I-like protein with 3'-5' exonuclease and polymerase domains
MKIKCLPTIHPAAVLKTWEWRYLAVHDLRRAKRWSSYVGYPEIKESFLVRPSYEDVLRTLQFLLLQVEREPTFIAADIETRARQIACIGLAWSKADAICIPFMCVERPEGFYSFEEERAIVLLLRQLLTHRNVRVIGQNWQYDYQYLAKHWGFEVNIFLDTMSEHHTNFPGLPKALDFLSSMYADIHIFWKNESKDWVKGMPEDTLWVYNCRDAVRTYEAAMVLLEIRNQMKLKETSYGTPYTIQQSLNNPIARASARGVLVDHDLRRRMVFMLQEDIASAQAWLNRIIGHDFNPNSHPQMFKLFYEELNQPKILHRKTHRPTLDDQALEVIMNRDVLLRPLCQGILHIRSLRNALSFCGQPLDTDGRLRCSYIIPGTETFRFASKSDPFDYGTNLQNISSGDRAEKDFPMHNLRTLLIPDAGHTMGEFDLPQADARVVAWEAEDEDLIELFLDPTRHLHIENASILFPNEIIKKGTLKYYYAKQGVHLTNYGGTPPVLAKTLNITVHEADQFQKRWFSVHPAIAKWHRRVLLQLSTKRFVENAFGYRRFYFGRIEDTLKEALAWIPQSTVAIATNLGILNVDRSDELRNLGVQFLLQVHDSSVFQWPTFLTEHILPKMYTELKIIVPYPRPLVFQGGAKISNKSWGECSEVEVKA